jgi:hypothetical protein
MHTPTPYRQPKFNLDHFLLGHTPCEGEQNCKQSAIFFESRRRLGRGTQQITATPQGLAPRSIFPLDTLQADELLNGTPPCGLRLSLSRAWNVTELICLIPHLISNSNSRSLLALPPLQLAKMFCLGRLPGARSFMRLVLNETAIISL